MNMVSVPPFTAADAAAPTLRAAELAPRLHTVRHRLSRRLLVSATLLTLALTLSTPAMATPDSTLNDGGETSDELSPTPLAPTHSLNFGLQVGYHRVLDEHASNLRMHGPLGGFTLGSRHVWERMQIVSGFEASYSAVAGRRPFDFENPYPGQPVTTYGTPIPRLSLRLGADALVPLRRGNLTVGALWLSDMRFLEWDFGDSGGSTHHYFSGLALQVGFARNLGRLGLRTSVEIPLAGWTARSRYGLHDATYLRVIARNGAASVFGNWRNGQWTGPGDVFTVRWLSELTHPVSDKWTLEYGTMVEVTKVWLHRDATWTTAAARFGASWTPRRNQ